MTSSLPTIKRKNYAQQARDIIETAIMRGDFELGEKLTEENIAKQLNISRVPVREALRALEKYGLVEVKPSNGVWVISPDAKDIEEVFDIRALNEPYALELCFKNSPEKTIIELEHQIMDFENLLEQHGDRYDLINQDLKFDEIIFLRCGNNKLTEIWSILVPTIKIGFFHNPYFKENNSIVNNRSHREIVAVFKKGQIDTAKNSLTDHILKSKKLICESFKKEEE